MNWKQGLDAYSANAETSFVKMRIFVDMLNTKDMSNIRYEATVETLNCTILTSEDNIASMPAAKVWCVMQYALLLHAEQEVVMEVLAQPLAD